MKRKIIVSTIVILAIISLTIFSFASGIISKEFLFGQSLKEAKEINGDIIVATINGDKIYKKDIAFIKWQYDNSTETNSQSLNIDKSDNGIITKIAKEKLIIQEAKKKGIIISNEELKSIQDRFNNSYSKNTEKNNDFINGLGVTKDEFIEQMVTLETNRIIKSKFLKEITLSISNNTFITNDESFKNKIDEFKIFVEQSKANNNSDIGETSKKLLELYNAYIDSLLEHLDFQVF